MTLTGKLLPHPSHPDQTSKRPRPSLRGLQKESRDKTAVTATVASHPEPKEPRGRRPSTSLYPGAGPHGIPLEGKDGGWKDHPSHMLYQTQGINHNDINIPDSCVLV